MSIDSHHIEGLELTRFLARGGSASVYVARDSRHSRNVAVKIFDQSDVEERRRRTFRREVQAMGRLDDHPNVLSVFDSGFTEQGAPYLVMPLVSTGTVATRITAKQPFLLVELLNIAVRLTSALATAHERGILHCDIKPSNIFLGQFGDPLLGDLGISSVSDSGITTTNQVSMTLRYAAPEIINNKDHTDKTDLYSLGATLFAMTDLAPPFSAKSSAALVGEIVGATEPPTLHRDVPIELATLLRELMAIDPADRPESAREVVDRLQQVQRSIGATVTPAAIGRALDDSHDADTVLPSRADAASLSTTGKPSRQKNRVLVAAAAALVLVVGGLLSWSVLGSGGESTESVDDEVAGVEVFASVEPESDELAPDELAPAVVVERSEDEAAAEVAEAAVVAAPPLALDEMTLVGRVTESGGQPVEFATVDLFAADESRPRGDFIEGYETDPEGRYGFAVATGCYVVTFVAPEGSVIEGGGVHRDVPVCVSPGETSVVDAAVVAAPQGGAEISGSVRSSLDQSTVDSVDVDVFRANDDESRGDFVASTQTGGDGVFVFDVPAGCYIVTFIAPEGRTLVGGDQFLNSPVTCVDVRTGAVFDAELN